VKIRLHEIEYGSANPEKMKAFYGDLLGLETTVDQEGLKVFDTGIAGLDVNCSNHIVPPAVITSFITDDLPAIIGRLQQSGVPFEGPAPSHLGMTCIQFTNPDGFCIKVNTPTAASPPWLKV
jgi:catechol 2,3-dioxygenase-like lactoylglutathione lyase family enzyme